MSKAFFVDHSQDWDDDSYFFSEASFCVADWILMDLICNHPSLALYKILPYNMLLRLFFNVLPGGDTMLHKLVLKRDDNSLNVIKTAFEAAKEYGIELPILANNNGLTPLDIVLEVDQPTDDVFKTPQFANLNIGYKKKNKQVNKKTENLIVANVLL